MTAPAGTGTPAAPSTTPTAAAAALPTVTTTPPAPADGGNYTAPASQDDLNRIIEQRLSRERAKYGVTPDEVATMKAELDAIKAEAGSDAEKAVKAAEKAANEAADAKYRPMMAETAFRVAIGDAKPAVEVDEFIADLNLARFLKDDGTVDTAKVRARVAQFMPAANGKTPPAPKGPVVPGHTSGPAPQGAGDSARAWLAQQGITKTG